MAMLLGNMGADWLLKRAFKFLLKKNLGSILQSEVRAQEPIAQLALFTEWRPRTWMPGASHMCGRAPLCGLRCEASTRMMCSCMRALQVAVPMQVDLDMLNVSLGTGTLEVHSALLNTKYLDAQLVCALTLAQSTGSFLRASRS